MIHEDMSPGHEDAGRNRRHTCKPGGTIYYLCSDCLRCAELCPCIWKCKSCGIIHKDMPPGHKGHDSHKDDGHEDDSGNYSECKPGDTIPYTCKECLNAACKCKWKCDHCGGIADLNDDFEWLKNYSHLRENGKKCAEYRPGVTIPYLCRLDDCQREYLDNNKSDQE